MAFALTTTSAGHLVLLALDLHGSHDSHEWHKFLFDSKLRARLSISITWVLGFATSSNNLWSFYVDPETETCFLTWHSDFLRYMVRIVQIIRTIVLPLGTIAWCYFSLFRTLLEANKYYKLRNEAIHSCLNEPFHRAAKRHLVSLSIRTALLVLVCFVTWIPGGVLWVMYSFKILENDVFGTWYGKFVSFVPFFNSVVNPILYGWSWPEFRELLTAKVKNCIDYLSNKEKIGTEIEND